MKNKIITLTLNPCLDKTVEINSFKIGAVNRVSALRIDAGGKGINVSRVLSDSGIDTLALGITGGTQGEMLERLLAKENVPFDFLHTANETRINLKIYDPITKNTTDINESGAELTEEIMNSFYEKLTLLLPDTRVLVISGSVPPGCDTSVYASIISAAKKHDVKVILDADGELLLKGIEAIPAVIKPNIDELERLCGKTFSDEKEILSELKLLCDKGIELIALSLGENGALFYSKNKIIKAQALTVDVKSTVGCGDSMTAAIAYSVYAESDFEKMCKTATAAGSLTAAKNGTELCRISEALKASEKVKIENIVM